ncbi:DUF4232 domain-containing protein [Streptomyces sp. NPDC051320]|uniref:DUF4232 domain-containing protein n=1 Tax=Streptomyces sp. NPDC051320 TaxID=3154644 RepID=UPI00343CE4F1
MAEQHWTSTVTRARAPRIRTARRLGGAGLAVVAVAGLGFVGAGAAQAAGSRTVPTCTTSGLSASFGQGLAGGMNHQGVVLKLKNTSSHACDLRGYPGLGLQDAGHHTVASSVHWGSTWYTKGPAKQTLTLKSGQSAEAVIAWTHANTGTSGARHASYLVVTPPAATTHKTLKFPQWVDNGDLDVTALASHISITG